MKNLEMPLIEVVWNSILHLLSNRWLRDDVKDLAMASRRDNLNHRFIPFEQSLAARRREGPGDGSQRDNSNHRFVPFEQSLAARQREGPGDGSQRDNSNHRFVPVKQSLAASKSEGFGYISRSGSLEQSSSMRSNTASVSRFDLPTSPHTACNSMRSNTASVTSLDLPTSSHTAYNSKRSNIEAKRFLAKRDYFDNLRYRYATEGAFPEVLMQFITVSPYIVMSSMNDEILVYPAEISITDFSLRRGIQSCWSSLVNFDPKYLGVNRHLCDYNVVEQKAAVLDIPLRTSLGINPCNVWKILTTKCHSNGVLVCDAEQAEIVERALAFLAGTVGCEELTKHAEVVERMFTAQSFMAHLARDYYRVVKAPAPIHLKRDRIDLEFSKAKERSRCFSKCCDYHESRLSDHQSRQHCPLSRAAVLIDAVCTLSFSANLDNFRDHYVPEKHLMNIVLVDSPSLQNDHDMSRRTEHAVNGKTAQADRGAAKSTNFGCYSKKSPKIRYEIVSPEENPFKRHRKVKVDLIHAISRMAKMCSMDDPIVIHP
ncbi:hypothetical protein KIN20_016950 [Parelaphostrongylus tenuis]|uniref:Maelstrom domain-containing protein n=1 Tax=Parelaphostrongylus tenuis TaxID=148309 RepID=A0AAD5MKT4_PARTN|nr:hypothetical protein KIN20_016950 [Parelaphostrongylus tenuis]